MKNDPDTVVVQVKHIIEVAEPTGEPGAEPGPTQPEIVGRKVKETDEDEAGDEKKDKKVFAGTAWSLSGVRRNLRPTGRVARVFPDRRISVGLPNFGWPRDLIRVKSAHVRRGLSRR